MKLKVLMVLVMLGLLPLSLSAKKALEFTCDNRSTCVNDKNFYVEVKRVVRRGDTLLIQIEYVSKRIGFRVDFTYGKQFEGYAMILDSAGQEFKIDGKELINFSINKNEKKVMSLRFKGNEAKKIVEPFDLTIKAMRPHGEITLFDLKQESRFRKVSPTVSKEGN